jgi:hypothetical protein
MRVSLGPAPGLLAGSLLAHVAIIRLSYLLPRACHDIGIDQLFGFLAFDASCEERDSTGVCCCVSGEKQVKSLNVCTCTSSTCTVSRRGIFSERRTKEAVLGRAGFTLLRGMAGMRSWETSDIAIFWTAYCPPLKRVDSGFCHEARRLK